MNVQGLTDQQFTEALRQQLSKYVKDPDVDVFVREYYNRDGAVVGAVQKPGLYDLTSRSDSLLDMINRAGGVSERGSGSVVFIPAAPATHAASPVL